MAIYHFHSSIIGRSNGRSSIAAAAYRSGEKLCDIMKNIVFNYTKKTKVDHTMIMGGWTDSREYLWNIAELYEKRKNSRTAREFNIALPIELDHNTKVALTKHFVKILQKKWKFIADIAFHDLSGKNPHVHIMITTRYFTGGIGFGNKIRDLDKKSTLIWIRKIWADVVNAYLLHYNIDQKIDHRSYEAQGIAKLPGCHLGPYAHRIEKNGGISLRRKWYKEWCEILAGPTDEILFPESSADDEHHGHAIPRPLFL